MPRKIGTTHRARKPLTHGLFIKTHHSVVKKPKPIKTTTGTGRHKKPKLDPYGHPELVGANPPDPGNTPYINNPALQTSNGAYLWLQQHPEAQYHPPAPKTPPNVKPPVIPHHHVHGPSPTHKAKVVTQHPVATLPFSAVLGTSSKTPHLHTYSAIAAQEARK